MRPLSVMSLIWRGLNRIRHFIGGFFVYKSPPKRHHIHPLIVITEELKYLTRKELCIATGIPSHLSKKELISRYLNNLSNVALIE